MDVKQTFDNAAADYDRNRRQLVPGFDQFYGMVLELIPYGTDAEFRILDIGAGTGLLSALVSEMYPNAIFTLVDLSSEMLSRAQARFAERSGFSYQVLDVENDPISDQYDVAISALALHHIELVKLEHAFQNIYTALDSNGLFINADQTLGTTPANEQKYAQMWIEGVRALGSTEEDIQAALERMKADKTATLEAQLTALRSAGFAHVDCWFKHYRFAVYSGQKS